MTIRILLSALIVAFIVVAATAHKGIECYLDGGALERVGPDRNGALPGGYKYICKKRDKNGINLH